MGFFVSVVVFWAVAFFLIKVVELRTNGRISQHLERYNVSLQFGLISFSTKRFNANLEQLGKRHRRFLGYWFLCGVVFGLIGLLSSVVILSSSLFTTFSHSSVATESLTSRAARMRDLLDDKHGHVPLFLWDKRPWWVPSIFWKLARAHDHNWLRDGHDWRFNSNSWRAWSKKRLERVREWSKRHDLRERKREEEEEERLDAFEGGLPGGKDEGGPHPKIRTVVRALRIYLRRRKRRLRAIRRASKLPPSPNDPPVVVLIRRIRRFPSLLTSKAKAYFSVERQSRRGNNASNRMRNRIELVGKMNLRTTARYVTEINPKHRLRGMHRHSGYASAKRHGHGQFADRAPSRPNSNLDSGERAKHGEPLDDASPGHQGHSSATHTRPLKRSGNGRGTMLTPLLPGVTIPVFHVWYIVIAILIAAVTHELGHALAASMHDAHIDGVGGFLALVFPGAYVQLIGVEKLSTLAQLKVHCAGAWHNFAGAVFSLALVVWLPSLLSIGYIQGEGALVVSMPHDSPLINHIEPGDIVLGFGAFPVKNGGPSFRKAVKNLVLSNDSTGFCVSQALYQIHNRPPSRCCDLPEGSERDEQHRGLQCFSVVGISKRKSCLRQDVVSQLRTCRRSEDCPFYSLSTHRPRDPGGMRTVSRQSGRTLKAAMPISVEQLNVEPRQGASRKPRPINDLRRETCFTPVLSGGQQLIDIRVQNVRTGKRQRLYYEGYPHVLGHSLTVSSYIPRSWAYLPTSVVKLLAILDVPNRIERFLQYFASVSLALALLNMAPVFWLDGEDSSRLFLKLFVPKMPGLLAARLRSGLLCLGTLLLVLNVVAALIEYDVGGILPP